MNVCTSLIWSISELLWLLIVWWLHLYGSICKLSSFKCITLVNVQTHISLIFFHLTSCKMQHLYHWFANVVLPQALPNNLYTQSVMVPNVLYYKFFWVSKCHGLHMCICVMQHKLILIVILYTVEPAVYYGHFVTNHKHPDYQGVLIIIFWYSKEIYNIITWMDRYYDMLHTGSLAIVLRVAAQLSHTDVFLLSQIRLVTTFFCVWNYKFILQYMSPDPHSGYLMSQMFFHQHEQELVVHSHQIVVQYGRQLCHNWAYCKTRNSGCAFCWLRKILLQ